MINQIRKLFSKAKPAAAKPVGRTDSITMSCHGWATLEIIANREGTEAGAIVEGLIELDELVNQHAEAEARARAAKGTWRAKPAKEAAR